MVVLSRGKEQLRPSHQGTTYVASVDVLPNTRKKMRISCSEVGWALIGAGGEDGLATSARRVFTSCFPFIYYSCFNL